MAIIFILNLLWLGRELRIIFFYLYLWQLKEYHLGRFYDHFRTTKGKRLIFHPLKMVKILLFLISVSFFFFPLIAFLLNPLWLFSLLIVYGFEAGVFLRDVFRKTLKRPTPTIKTIFLGSIAILALGLVLIINNAAFSNDFQKFLLTLLILDIFSPFLISLLIVSLQPLTVAWRKILIARAKRKRAGLKNLIVIGITGSYGKTSTKEFLTTILSQKLSVLSTQEHQNSEVGISRGILDGLNEKHQVFVVEMGAYGVGGIRLLADIVRPQIGIVCGINEQHLALFGNMQNLISAEGGQELVESLPRDGRLILNGDNQLILSNFRFLARDLKSPVFCSTKNKMDLWAENIKTEKDRFSFRVVAKEGQAADFKVNLVGQQDIENILLAAGAAQELGLTLEEIAAGAAKIKPEQGSLKLLKGKGGVDLIDSTYSTNTNGVLAALDHLKLWSGKKIIVMPCLIELGPVSTEAHRKIGKRMAEVCDLGVITTQDKFAEIKEEAVRMGMNPNNILFLEDPREIWEKIKGFCQEGNVLLLEGRVPLELLRRVKEP
ncbi:MAG: UDP-N-acetylmuramoyl-tripeptide--D-alanyl-D-alanine ligase [Candidatus Nealsonbacteria bacterium]|nr:UDP-N-acetylmuramoyl-tripeptide--D-alanyl-D-alanine ligase [Candidatus Nealsonbacteria bacterium]